MAEIGFSVGDVIRATRRAAPRPARGDAKAALLAPLDAASAIPEWAELASHSVEDNQFFHPDVVLQAINRISGGVELATVRNAAGDLIAAAPVTRGRLLGRVAPAVRVWSHDYGPVGVPLIDPVETETAIEAFIEQVAPAGGSLILPDLPLDGMVAATFQRLAAHANRPVTVLNPYRRAILDRQDAGDVRAAQPARRRKEYARQMRRLGELGELVIESVNDPELVRARFEEFLILEAAGWKGRNGTAMVSREETRSFARAMVQARAHSGAVRIDSIRLDRRPVAMLVSFVAGATAWTWKIAYAEGQARFSPGAQLMLEVPRQIFADPRIQRIDSLAAADHPMIDHLWPGRLSLGTLVIGPPGNNLKHRLGIAAAGTELRARGLARRLRARLKARGGKDKEKEA